MVRNDVVYKVKTSKGSKVLVVCTSAKNNFHYFSLYEDKGYPPEANLLMCIGEYEIDKQTPGKFESDHRKIADTEFEIADPLEAKSWINEQREGSFASHMFPQRKNALEFVDKLYEMGALKVSVWDISKAQAEDSQDMEFYADELVVHLPEEKNEREEIFSFLNKQELSEHYKENGQKTISLFWDY